MQEQKKTNGTTQPYPPKPQGAQPPPPAKLDPVPLDAATASMIGEMDRIVRLNMSGMQVLVERFKRENKLTGKWMVSEDCRSLIQDERGV